MGKNKKKNAKKQTQHVEEKKQDQEHEPVEVVEKETEKVVDTPEVQQSENKDDLQISEAVAPEVLEPKVNENTELQKKDAEIEALKKELAHLTKEFEETKSRASNEVPAQVKITTESEATSDQTEEFTKVKEERDHFESQYNMLLSRISSMKNVFQKMKESQRELELVQEQLNEYESQNIKLKSKVESVTKENKELSSTVITLNKEFSTLESEYEALENTSSEYEKKIKSLEHQLDNSSSTHSHALEASQKEKEQLDSQLQELIVILDNNKQDIADLKDEKEELKQNLQTYENEKKNLENLVEQVSMKLEEETNRSKENIQEKEKEINALRVQLDTKLETNKELAQEMQNLNDEIEKLKEGTAAKAKLEEESKNQAVQIAKLRHEAIILNEHLTKALAMLKKSSDSESVDKELISNLLISFVSIPRADPKKFEVLELLSSFLSWDDDKRQQAGLILDPREKDKNPGSMSRTQNFVSLWTDYLEKESEK
ncbi:hypothetical protein NCAS_0B01310 [Naumovozyma castellii]|uniref:GRIP domain-containing protein n=1 Tax=Naumovozyma castellii TaxID=27288 RepID=G0VB91_NAUCA|nr:hypothetical protein NCAS_0B01310 [Naumovozyma castellii CBS 4309]CCC68215.1 hypothetical protein NCAS_0B01310 [Naumovozyma castellii CBS 4309]